MTKQEFLAASLPYKLKLKAPYGFRPNGKESTGVSGIVFITGDLYADIENKTFSEEFIPIIRPIDSLTKECVQADYNDGKPFIPIVELAKMIIDLPDYNPYMQYNSVSAELHTDNSIFIIHKDRFTLFERDEYRIITCPKQLQLFQQMLKWHFYPNMPENEEVVYVTDEFNPYK